MWKKKLRKISCESPKGWMTCDLQSCWGHCHLGQKNIYSVYIYMGVSKNRDIPKSSILIGFWFSIINHPFWGTPVFGNTHITFHFFLLSRVVLHLRFLDADGKGDPKTILPNSGEKL